ncbi:OR22C protein [Vespula squamosa]|uniref:OR22C protein n=1 Tax=Vespula squamosa TaxID=30214 RepID=A0ABD2C1I0_VESSQ
MDIFEGGFYKYNYRLLSFLGLWPYKKSCLCRIYLVNIMLLSFNLPQFLRLFTSKKDIDIILKVIPVWGTSMNTVIKYYTYHLGLCNMKTLLNCVIIDWKIWNTEKEVEIMTKYAKEGRFYSLMYAGYVYFTSIVFFGIVFVPRLIDVIQPLNESRPLKLPILCEYFLDQNEHFYLIYFHLFISLLITVTVLIAVDTQLMIFTCHVCSIFAVVGYRLENFLKDAYVIENWTRDQRKRYRENLVLSINGHKKAIEFANCIESSFSYSLLIQCGINIICMTISLYQITEEIGKQLDEVLRYAAFIIAQLFHIFYTCYAGQMMIDHSTNIAEKAYNSMWYEAPKEINKLLLLIMKRSIEPSNLTAGKIFIFCIESFSSIFQLYTSKGDFNIIIEIVPTIATMINMTIKYYTYYIGMFNIRKLLDKMIIDWKIWNTKEEIEIIKRYAEEGRLYTLAYTIYIYVSTVLFLSISFLPLLLDVILPLNESRPLQPVVLGEYFIDQSEHFYFIFCHMSLTILLAMTIVIATDTQFFVFTSHICGVFSVVGFRFERLMKSDSTVNKYVNYRESFKYVTCSIKGHSKAIEFANLIESSFSTPLLVQCGINVACLSVSLYRMTTLLDMSTETFKYGAFLAAQLFHIFCICYSGQRIIDHSSETFLKAYNGLWYEAPIEIRKLLLLVIRRGIKPSKLTGGKIFVFCLKGFSTSPFRSLNDMDIFKNRFYKINYRLLSFLGLWPYEKFRLSRVCLMNIPMLSFNLTQILKLYTSKGNFDIIKEVIPVWIVSSIVVIKYYLFDFSVLDIKWLMDNMIMDWNMWKSKEEIDIMKKFSHLAKMYTLGYTIYIYIFMSLFLLATFIPSLMDVIIPLNESRHMDLPVLGEYFVDEEKHFYLIYSHMAISIIINITTFIATDTQLMVFCCHVSGVFSVVSFRLENFLENDTTLNGLSDSQKKECYNHVSLSIKGHKRALEFVKRMESLFSSSLLIQCGLNVLCMSICLYQVVVLYDQSIEVIKFIAIVCAELFHLLFASLAGQNVIDSSSEIYIKAYSGLWYEAPIEVRKLLILIMRRSFKPSQLSAGKIFVYCLDGFAMSPFRSLNDMDIFKNRFYKINYRLLSSLGLWPYEKSHFSRAYLVNIPMLSFNLTQILKLYTSKGNFDIIKEVIPVWVASSIVIIKYYLFNFSILDIKWLMDNMIMDWNMWKSKEEIDIMKKFSHLAKMYTLGYTIYIYGFMSLFLLATFIPPLMDVIIPLNESRHMKLPALGEYFVDEEKHFYLIYSHMAISIIINVTTFIATDTQLMVFCCHVSGVFSVVGFRLENFLKNNMIQDGLSDPQKRECYNHVSLSIKGHERALEFVKRMESLFSYSLLIQCGLNVLCMSFCLYQINVLYNQSAEAIKYIVLVIGELFHLLFASLAGQNVIDTSSEVYFKAYSGLWYEAPMEIRKLLIVIMKRSLEPARLSAGKIYIYCLDGFSTVLKLCTSNANFDIMKEVIPVWVTSLNVVIKYYTFDLSILDIKLLMDNMIIDWNMWKSKEEINIMEKFANLGRLYTLAYTIYIYVFMSLFLLVTFIPPLMDIIIPLNESRHMELPVLGEYFVDEEKHFYLIYSHMAVTITISITILIATDTQLMVFCCHVSGAFAVVGFRLEHFLKSDVTLDELSELQRKECYKHVSISIRGHKRALEFVKRMESLFSYSLLMQCGLNIICMSICLYQIMKLYDNSIETIKFTAFFIGELIHLFVTSLSGQTIIDHSSDVYFKAYSGLWYEAPIEVRKLLILIMRRSLEPSKLTAGDIFIYCLDGFATLLKVYTSKGNFDIIKEIIPVWAVAFNVLIKYYVFDVCVLDIKYLMDNMIIDWNMWKSKEEIDIMEKFANLGRMYTLAYTICIYVFMSLFLLVAFIPPLMDIIIPSNESRHMELPVLGEYFLDKEKHFHLIYCHMVVSIIIIITVLIATDTQFIVFCCHVSGAFAVVSFRLEHFLKNDITLDGLSDLQRKESYDHISLSIKGHKRALEFLKRMESSFSYSLLIQCGLNILCMSICLYQIKIMYGQSMKTIKYIALIFGELFHLFVASLSGQTIMDHSTDVYFKAYSGLWYEAPIEARKLLILIMRRSFKPSQVTAGKIFVYCLEGFATLLKVYTSKGNFDIIKEIIPVWAVAFNVLIKYYVFDVCVLDIKYLMDNMIIDWSMWKSKEEIDIMEKFANLGRMYTLAYTIYIYVFMTLFLLVTFIPPLMDIIIPLNESRHMELPVLGEYFLDKEKHFHLIYCHMVVSIIIIITVLIATDTQFIVFCCHVSGAFAVVSFRLEHFLKNDMTLDGLSDLQRKESYNHISLSIKGHKRALEFLKRMESSFSYSLLIQCGLNILCMSICLYQIKIMYGQSMKTIKYIALIFGELFHLFVASLSGQAIMDHSTDVHFKAYSGLWYEAPIEARKLLILIMRRSFKPSQVTAGKIFVYCLEGFATLLKLYTSRGNFDIIKDILPVWLASTIIVIKYYLFDLNLLDIKLLMDNMIMDWNMWKSKEEIDIMKKFAHSGRMYTLVYTIYIYVFVSLLLLVTFIPPLMDVIIPLNESRPMELPTLGEYFINQEKHFYLIYCHMFFSIMIAVTILIATDTQLMVFCCHVSGTFAVIGFRLEHFWRKDATLDGLSDLQRKECYNHVSLSIKGHKRALEFVKRMESLFSYSLLVQCGLNVICMSICLYQISVLYGESIQILKFIAFLFCEIFHLFIASLSGQTIIDHSSNVYFKAYSGLWYEAPIEVRKLLILIMRRSFKPSQVTAGKIFVYCLDGFSTVK